MAARGSFLKVGHIIFILGNNIAKCKDMPHGTRSAEIGNSKWPWFSWLFEHENHVHLYLLWTLQK
jgi:hypothetical protein